MSEHASPTRWSGRSLGTWLPEALTLLGLLGLCALCLDQGAAFQPAAWLQREWALTHPAAPAGLWTTLAGLWPGGDGRGLAVLGLGAAAAGFYILVIQTLQDRGLALLGGAMLGVTWGVAQSSRLATPDTWVMALLLWSLVLSPLAHEPSVPRWRRPVWSLAGGVLGALMPLLWALGGWPAAVLLLGWLWGRSALSWVNRSTALGVFLMTLTLSVVSLWHGAPIWPMAEGGVTPLSETLMAALTGGFPWTLLGLVAVLRPLGRRPLRLGWMLFWGTLWSVLAPTVTVHLGTLLTPLVLWAALSLAQGSDEDADSPALWGLDATLLALMAVSLGLAVYGFLGLPDVNPGDLWRLPGLAVVKTLVLLGVPVTLPEPLYLWKWWLLPLPLGLLLGGLLLLALRLSEPLETLLPRSLMVLTVWMAGMLGLTWTLGAGVLHRPIATVFQGPARLLGDRPLWVEMQPGSRCVLADPARRALPVASAEGLSAAWLRLADRQAPRGAVHPATEQPLASALLTEATYYAWPPALRQRLRVSAHTWVWTLPGQQSVLWVDLLPASARLP